MSLFELDKIKGISEKRKKILNKLNINSISDLISTLPRDYEDHSTVNYLVDAVLTEQKTIVKVEVTNKKSFYTRKRLLVTEVTVQDDKSQASLFLFGKQSQYISLKVGNTYFISGLFRLKGTKIESSQFQIQSMLEDSSAADYPKIISIYKLTEGVTQKQMKEWVSQALDIMKPFLEKENLPNFLIKKNDLMDRYTCFKEIHFPTSSPNLKKAQYRIKYIELFKAQLQFALKKYYFQSQKKQEYKKHCPSIDELLSKLPFELTADQQQAVNDVKQDLYSTKAMHRLLMGDVGCGKTLVSIITLLIAVDSGYQAVLLAPTEVLAKQHFKTILSLINSYHIRVELLLGNTKLAEKKMIHHQLQNGECQILVGTHALFSEKLKYYNLSLIVIDEQHKFGVQQRMSLINKASHPDILSMSATPIPRTLSYSLFGDMDVSIIKEKPSQRLEIQTSWYEEDDIQKAYEHIRIQLQNHKQGYIVYPLVEENTNSSNLQSISQSFTKLKEKIFPEYKIGFIHGKLSTQEKTFIMKQFEEHKIDILISTTVIEVGVDVRNTTFIMINNANYFGLSTLHQLRGRVGRNNEQSYCYLITSSKNTLTHEAIERMKVITEHHDGFILAEKDLHLRGTGNLLSTEQKGKDGFKLASLVYDSQILKQAREDAFDIIQKDPKCQEEKHSLLKSWVMKFEEEYFAYMQN